MRDGSLRFGDDDSGMGGKRRLFCLSRQRLSKAILITSAGVALTVDADRGSWII